MVYAFEPTPEAFVELLKTGAICYNVALGMKKRG